MSMDRAGQSGILYLVEIFGLVGDNLACCLDERAQFG